MSKTSLPGAAEIGTEIMAHADALAACSEPGPGVTRLFATPQHKAASDLIRGWMDGAGMSTRIDAAGNLVGRYEGLKTGAPALMFGSHQDTVRSGGRYDGMLGIITPIACVKYLHDNGERFPFAIEVIAFGDEEGVRFQTTLLGSRAIAGTFDAAVLGARDEGGVTLADALRSFGGDPDAIQSLARRKGDILAFVELHIEQGPVLEAKGLPVAVVTAIGGGTRLRVTVEGSAGHAGTVPMATRRDALAGCAEAILAVEEICGAAEDTVGTVGMVTALPGATNVIPGEANFTVDIRAAGDVARLCAVDQWTTRFNEIIARRGLVGRIEKFHEAEAKPCTPALMDRLSAAVADEGIAPCRLFSGAGHDAMAMADAADMAMLFVRCEGGVSHDPAEAITGEDAGIGARVLLRFIGKFSEA